MEKFSCKPCLKGCFVRLRFGFDIPEHIAPVRRWGEGRRECMRVNERARDKAKGDMRERVRANDFARQQLKHRKVIGGETARESA